MLLLATLLQAASPTPPPVPSPGEIVAAAPASAWSPIASDDLLVVELSGGRRFVVQLFPAFAPAHVANIRALARAGWWDGTSVNRVQDNYVVQWGDATEKKPLPPPVDPVPPAEYEQRAGALALLPLDLADAYAERVAVARDGGWPVAVRNGRASLVHCYAMVGVGRNLAPDTGSGAELYAVIGHAPRHLDRNIALVGRVVEGIDALSSLPRGTEALGFYRTAAERRPIIRARLASQMPAAERPAFEVMRVEDEAFAAYVRARANRRDPFFNVPAASVDICNVAVPVRRARPSSSR